MSASPSHVKRRCGHTYLNPDPNCSYCKKLEINLKEKHKHKQEFKTLKKFDDKEIVQMYFNLPKSLQKIIDEEMAE